MTELTTRFQDALVFATALHQTQRRKVSEVPYVAHLLGTASIALEYGATEDEAIAALLHDAIEDQGGATVKAEILERFGPEVTAIVEGCSDTEVTPKPPWQGRKEAYLRHLATASPSVLLVSTADKLYNALSIVKDYAEVGSEIWSRFSVPREKTIWYYQQLAIAFSQRGENPLNREYARVIRILESLP